MLGRSLPRWASRCFFWSVNEDIVDVGPESPSNSIPLGIRAWTRLLRSRFRSIRPASSALQWVCALRHLSNPRRCGPELGNDHARPLLRRLLRLGTPRRRRWRPGRSMEPYRQSVRCLRLRRRCLRWASCGSHHWRLYHAVLPRLALDRMDHVNHGRPFRYYRTVHHSRDFCSQNPATPC